MWVFKQLACRCSRKGEILSLGKHTVKWLDTPHLPRAWETGCLMESQTRTLFCGDLFTQGGSNLPVLADSDILKLSETFRRGMDYFSHSINVKELMEKFREGRTRYTGPSR